MTCMVVLIESHSMRFLQVFFSLSLVQSTVTFWHVWLLCHVCEPFLVVLKVDFCVYELSYPFKHFLDSYTMSWERPHKCRHGCPKVYPKCRTHHFLLWDNHSEGNDLLFVPLVFGCHVVNVCDHSLSSSTVHIFRHSWPFLEIFSFRKLKFTGPRLSCALQSLNPQWCDLALELHSA